MEDFRCNLAKRGKTICPQCEKKTFVLYIDNTTGNPLHPTVGKCDRSVNCAYHYAPKDFFKDNNIPFDNKKPYAPHTQPAPKPQPSYIDRKLMERTLTGYDNNQLVQFLSSIVGDEAARQAADKYKIGTTRSGGTVFWEIDLHGKVRTGKIIVYGGDGHRRKDVTPPVQWVHSILKLPNFCLGQCLFAEHLLADRSKPIAIVESEKTSLIASCYFPDFIWLASGGCEGLNADKCRILAGRRVILFPDAKCFDKWSAKALELSKTCRCDIFVSRLIDEIATEEEKNAGLDLVDYLIKFHPSDFARQKQLEASPIKQSLPDSHKSTNLWGYENLNTQNIAYYKIGLNPNRCPAYVSDDGILYIPTPPDCQMTYTVYQTVNDYNQRLIVPKIISMKDVDVSNMRLTFIDLKTLTIQL